MMPLFSAGGSDLEKHLALFSTRHSHLIFTMTLTSSGTKDLK